MLWVCFPSPTPSGPSLLCYPGKVYGPLFQVLQLLRVTDSSPSLMTSGLALPNASGIDGWEASLPCPYYNMADETALPCSQYWGWLMNMSTNRVSSTVHSSWVASWRKFLHPWSSDLAVGIYIVSFLLSPKFSRVKNCRNMCFYLQFAKNVKHH